MDPIAALKAARREVAALARALGVGHWKIAVSLTDDGDRAFVRTAPEYEQAFIGINPAQAAGEDDIRDAIRHEILHVVTSPIDLVHDAIAAIHPEGTPERLLLDEQFRQVAEMLVVNAERMYQALARGPGGKGKAR